MFPVNIDSVPGAVGFSSVLFPFVYPVRLIRVTEAGDVIRDSDGLCVLCQPGEPGEFVGKIVKNHPSRSFDGYVDKAATEKKIVRDVLRKGDMWFRSGDLLTMDEFGWMYFVDRMGDTFRYLIYKHIHGICGTYNNGISDNAANQYTHTCMRKCMYSSCCGLFERRILWIIYWTFLSYQVERRKCFHYRGRGRP